MSDGEGSLRLDKWLWFARLARTRSLAARLCAEGCVVVEGALAIKPHQTVRVGDSIIVAQGQMRRRLRVLALGVRRGPPAEARRLYDEPAPPIRLSAAELPRWTPLLDEEAG